MYNLQEILDHSDNGLAFVNLAKDYNFTNIRIFNSSIEDTLTIFVPKKQEWNEEISKNAALLRLVIASTYDCKVEVLLNNFSSSQEEEIIRKSIALPITDKELLVPIFGDPSQYSIKSISQDTRYILSLKTDEEIYKSFLPTQQVKSPLVTHAYQLANTIADTTETAESLTANLRHSP